MRNRREGFILMSTGNAKVLAEYPLILLILITSQSFNL